jgi:hypothetical protein
MSKPIKIITNSHNREYQGRHRFEHWLADNQVYFITARCRDRFPAFASEAGKEVFWDRFDFCTNEFGLRALGHFIAGQSLSHARILAYR